MIRLCIILCVFLSSFCVQAQRLTYLAISSQAEPFQIIAQPNAGIVTDILAEAVQNLDITFTQRAYPFKRYLRMMHSDQYPLWISYGSPAWQGASELNLQSRHLSKETLFDVTHVLVVKADRNFNFDSIEALFGENVITLDGFHYPGLDEYFASGEINKLAVRSHENALTAIENNRGIAFVSMKIRVLYSINKAGLDRNKFKIIDFSSIVPPYPIHLSYSPTVDEKTKLSIDEAIAELKKSGKIDQIIKFYQGI